MGFYTPDELAALGLARVGTGVKLSRRAMLHGASRIAIGDYTRIDDFCLMSAGEGGIEIGRHSHLAVMCTLIGAAPIVVGDYCGISGKASVYSSSDDFGGEWMTNPTLPAEFTRVHSAPVRFGHHALVGAGGVVMPGTTFGEAAVLGSLGLAKGELQAFGIYGGVPAKLLRERSRRLLDLQRAFESRDGHGPA